MIKGKSAPVIGRIAMNMIVVDITEIKNTKAGDEVVLLGKAGNEEITADELAERIGTINYEVVSRIGSHIKRVIV